MGVGHQVTLLGAGAPDHFCGPKKFSVPCRVQKKQRGPSWLETRASVAHGMGNNGVSEV